METFEQSLPRAAAVVREGIDSGLHLGAQVFVSLSGRIVADAAVGLSRIGTPMQTDTLTLWLSAGKPLGAISIALLLEAGKIGLDQPVAETIPEFAAGGKESITIRHILTHSGGFRAVAGLSSRLAWEEAVRLICAAPLEPGWIPGETVGYHPKSSWWILGEIVRRVDGRPYDRIIREAICEPIGMIDTWIGFPPERWREYGDRIGGMFNTDPRRPGATGSKSDGWESEAMAARCIPGANTRGPVRELGRFYAMLLGGGKLDGVRLLNEETAALFTRTHLTGRPDLSFKRPIHWGLGFIVNGDASKDESIPYGYGRHASPAAFGHSGRESTVGMADPRHQLVIAATFNGMPGEGRHQRRLRAFCSAVYEDLGLTA